MKPWVCVLGALVLMAGCSPVSKEAKQEMAQPVNCATAPADLRALEAEKAHVGKQIAAGITAIVPVSLVVNVVTGTEKEHFQVATGKYDDMIDEKMAEIKTTCGL